jgi:hypothetical protein
MLNMSKFKIGDKVRVIKSKTNDHQTRKYIGEEFIVGNSSGSCIYYKTNLFLGSELELVATKEQLERLEILKSVEQLKISKAIKHPQPTHYICQDIATIVFFDDETKIVVKQHEDDEWDMEKAIAIAISKKVMGGYKKFDEFVNNCEKVMIGKWRIL